MARQQYAGRVAQILLHQVGDECYRPTAGHGDTPAGWTANSSLSFVTPITGSTQLLDGNDAAKSRILTANLPVTVLRGEYLALRWYDADDGEAAVIDSSMGVDDLTVSFFTTAVPEASAFLLEVVAAGAAAASWCVSSAISRSKRKCKGGRKQHLRQAAARKRK
jgi:hypothetical protein